MFHAFLVETGYFISKEFQPYFRTRAIIAGKCCRTEEVLAL